MYVSMYVSINVCKNGRNIPGRVKICLGGLQGGQRNQRILGKNAQNEAQQLFLRQGDLIIFLKKSPNAELMLH
jgi:hypothetical protein